MREGSGATPRRNNGWLLVVLLALSFTALTTYVNHVRYTTLRPTSAFDLAAFHNAMVNFAAGRDRTYLPMACWFSPGDHDGPSIFRSSHFTPLRLWLLPPLYALWPDITFLMLAQSAFVAAGAFALYGFALRRTGWRRLGHVLAVSYLLHPLVLHVGFNDFREIQLGLGPALFALGAHADVRRGRFLAAALLMLAARPEYAFLLALFPALNWRLTAARERGRAWLFAPAALALAWYGLTAVYSFGLYGVALPHLAQAGPASAGGLAALPERLPAYLRSTLLPGVLALLTPEAFAAALPFLAAARDVPWPKLPQDHLQHLSPALAATLWACTSTLVRLAPRWARDRRRRTACVAGLLLAALLSGAHFAWAVVDRYFLGGNVRYGRLEHVDGRLPRDATVLAAPRLVARFSGHTRVLNYAVLPVGAGRAGADEDAARLAALIAVADVVATEREPWLDALVERSGRFAPPVAAAGGHLFVVQPGARFAGDPDAALEHALDWPALQARRRTWLRLRHNPAPAGSRG